MSPTVSLNQETTRWFNRNVDRLKGLGCTYEERPAGGQWWNFTTCPPDKQLEAGQVLGFVCAGSRASMRVHRSPLQTGGVELPYAEVVMEDLPLAAMASQYAGLFIEPGGKFFGLGSGPMRRFNRDEPFFKKHPNLREARVLNDPQWRVFGVIETAETLTDEVFDFVADRIRIERERLVLLTASPKCLAGTTQVAMRVVETVGHIWHTKGWDVHQLRDGNGKTFIAPPAGKTAESLVRMNEGIAHTGDVIVTVSGVSDDELQARVKQLVFSSAYPGATFREVLETCGGDVQKMFREAPLAFAPGKVALVSAETGAKFSAGETTPETIAEAWESAF